MNATQLKAVRGAIAALTESAKQHRLADDTAHARTCDTHADNLRAAFHLPLPTTVPPTPSTDNESAKIQVYACDRNGSLIHAGPNSIPRLGPSAIRRLQADWERWAGTMTATCLNAQSKTPLRRTAFIGLEPIYGLGIHWFNRRGQYLTTTERYCPTHMYA